MGTMRFWCCVLAAAGATIFRDATDEASARELAKTADLKGVSSADLTFLIKEKKWLSAAQEILQRSQKTTLDFSAPVRSAVTAVRKELDDLIRGLDKSYGEASQVSPAFQWAQNSSHVFLQIKFAQRWNAPGALEVQNSSVAVSDCCFSFKGYGEHSMIKKEYKLFLQFLEPVEEAGSSWHFAAAGRLTVTIRKARAARWERLLRSANVRPENMGIWRDMAEKWEPELSQYDKGSGSGKKKQKSADDDDEDEDEEESLEELTKKCVSGSFSSTKVVEMCPDAFLPGKPRLWTVVFYDKKVSSNKMKSLMAAWKVLAETVPSHNRNAAIGSVDCSSQKAFCKSVGAAKFPQMLQFKPGSKTGVAYDGESSYEDMALWAAGAKEEL